MAEGGKGAAMDSTVKQRAAGRAVVVAGRTCIGPGVISITRRAALSECRTRSPEQYYWNNQLLCHFGFFVLSSRFWPLRMNRPFLNEQTHSVSRQCRESRSWFLLVYRDKNRGSYRTPVPARAGKTTLLGEPWTTGPNMAKIILSQCSWSNNFLIPI